MLISGTQPTVFKGDHPTENCSLGVLAFSVYLNMDLGYLSGVSVVLGLDSGYLRGDSQVNISSDSTYTIIHTDT